MISKRFWFLLVLGASACASGEDVSTTSTSEADASVPTVILPSYEPLIGSAATTLSALNGSVVTARTGSAQMRRVTGRVRHGGGKLVIDDGLFKFADDDGFDANGEAMNEGVVLKLINPNAKYEYASLYSTSYTVGADTYTAVGAIGISTRDEDFPRQGSASYTGDAVYAFTSQSGNGFGGLGTYVAEVDFANAEINSSVTVTTAANVFTRATVADPAFDRIEMSNLAINGTAFSGTSMRTLRNGSAVQVTGANTSAQVEGQFYGIAQGNNGTVIPDEIAGNALLDGDDGNVILSFIGD